MRLALLVVGTLTTGAWSVGATHGVLPGPGQVFQAVTALGGDPGKVTVGYLNPVQAYNYVMQQVTSGRNGSQADFQPSAVTVTPGGFPRVNTPNIIVGTQNGLTPGVLSEMRQNNRRMEDMAAYARNPAAWHGMPPR